MFCKSVTVENSEYLNDENAMTVTARENTNQQPQPIVIYIQQGPQSVPQQTAYMPYPVQGYQSVYSPQYPLTYQPQLHPQQWSGYPPGVNPYSQSLNQIAQPIQQSSLPAIHIHYQDSKTSSTTATSTTTTTSATTSTIVTSLPTTTQRIRTTTRKPDEEQTYFEQPEVNRRFGYSTELHRPHYVDLSRQPANSITSLKPKRYEVNQESFQTNFYEGPINFAVTRTPISTSNRPIRPQSPLQNTKVFQSNRFPQGYKKNPSFLDNRAQTINNPMNYLPTSKIMTTRNPNSFQAIKGYFLKTFFNEPTRQQDIPVDLSASR